MTRRILIAAAVLFCSVAAFSTSAQIRAIDVNVELSVDGTASITERWDVNVTSGTEWYLVRSNLGDIVVDGLSVVDESGTRFYNEGEWDVQRSIGEKAGRCGLVHKSGGVEICWGVGSYGPHVYTVKYSMSNAVKSVSDYDYLHMQFVSPGLSSGVDDVHVSIVAPVALSTENARIWGFGFDGQAAFSDGVASSWSNGYFSTSSSVILLLRFDKGIFTPTSERSGSFDDVLSRAMSGADFGEDDGAFAGIIAIVLMVIGLIGLGKWMSYRRKKSILGCKPSEVVWARDVPFEGNLYSCFYVLNQLGELNSTANLASAAVLRMIYDGLIDVRKSGKDDVELCFTKDPAPDYDRNAAALYSYLKQASGRDLVLQKNEFARWGRRNYNLINSWTASVKSNGQVNLAQSGMGYGYRLSPKGQAEARKTLGFKKFLDEFTLIGERSTPEVGLWQDYLVFGALFGIAKKVADELKEINPDMFSQLTPDQNFQTYDMVRLVNSFGRSMRSAESAYSSAQAAKGMGGRTSFGGGGGFSGGGFGGGSR